MRLLYVSRGWSHHDIRFADAWRDAGVEFVALADDGTAPGDKRYAADALKDRIDRAVREFEPDVVHAGPLTDVVPLVRSVWSGALIAMSWGFDLMDEIDRDRAMREAATGVLATADRIVVDNNGPRARVLGLGADESRIVQFAWGVDVEFFTPGPSSFRAQHSIPSHAALVLCTRTHAEIYRVGDVVEAFAAAAARNAIAHLALAGSGPLTQQLRGQVDAAGLGSRVHFVGTLDAGELRDAHRAADLYVSASTVDGTSISLLEAMACGTPVCVSRIPGNAEWVDDSTGITFTMGDVDELSAVIVRLSSGDEAFDADARDRAAAALDRVRARADWRSTSAALPQIAVDAIQQHRTRLEGKMS